VPLGEAYRVNYVGKSSCSVTDRLATEHARYLAGRDGFFDPDAFRRGERLRCAEDFSVLRPVLESTSLFVAPLAERDPVILRVESAIIRCVRNADREVARFLANVHCRHPGTPPVEIVVGSDEPLEGVSATLLG
jgi:hypothetical protein